LYEEKETYIPVPDLDEKSRKVLVSCLEPDGTIKRLPSQPASIKGTYVSAVGVNGSGQITITYNARTGGNPPTANQTIILAPNTANAGSLVWDCSIATAGGTIPAKYRPANCR